MKRLLWLLILTGLYTSLIAQTVSGSIGNADGEGFQRARVQLVQVVEQSGQNVIPPAGVIWQADLEPANGGFVFADVSPGEYVLCAHVWGYEPYWYPGADHWSNAQRLLIGANTEITGLELLPIPIPTFAVSGTIQANPDEMEEVRIIIMPVTPDTYPDYEISPFPDGNWQFQLPEGDYLIGARVSGRFVYFWDEQHSVMDADILHLESDTFGVDFDLTTQTPFTGSHVYGNITVAGESPPFDVLVIAISSDEEEDWEDTVLAGPDGGFSFPDIPAGNYYLYAVSAQAPPTYLGDVQTWEESSTAWVDGSSGGYSIDMPAVLTEGLISLQGQVVDQSGNGVQGVHIVAKDSLGVVRGFTFTNNEGGYLIPSLPQGVFHLTAARTFCETDTQTAILFTDGIINFSMFVPVATNNGQAIPAVGNTVLRCVPNPFNPSAEIIFTISEPRVANISIYNMRGQRVRVLCDNQPLSGGQHRLVWNGRNDIGAVCPSGVYLCRMKTEYQNHQIKIMLMK